MMQVRLAKACRRRVAGAPMTVTERAAYLMMKRGEVSPDAAFMAAFEKAHGLPATQPEPKPAAKPRKQWGRPKKIIKENDK
jgi:hypothetical protein